MSFKEDLEALKESGEIIEIADKTRGIFGGIIKEVEDNSVKYIGIKKRTDDGYDYLVLSERFGSVVKDTEFIALKPIENFTIISPIVNISIRKMSEREKRKIRMYLLLLYEAEKKKKRRGKNEL